jgi:hypothetical protein
MGDPDDHRVVLNIGDGLASLPEAAEQDLVHEEPLDFVLDQTGDFPRPEFGGITPPGQPVEAAIGHREKDLLLGELPGEFGDGLPYDLQDHSLVDRFRSINTERKVQF